MYNREPNLKINQSWPEFQCMNIYRFKVLDMVWGWDIVLPAEVNMPNSSPACVGIKETSVL
jgi:hypothetical protein